MRKYLFTLLSILLLVAASFGQTAQPVISPTPKSVDTEDVVKISTTLIQVDATVTDKNGKIITDLKPEDFEILENGEKQNITNFLFVPTAPDTNAAPTRQNNKEENNIPIPAGQLRPEQIKRTIALVVDDLGLSFDSVYTVRTALRKFVDEQMQPNDFVAIILTSVGSGGLQQFTSDKRQLQASIDRLSWNSNGRAGVASFTPIEPTQAEQILAQGPPQAPDGAPNLAADAARNAEVRAQIGEERLNKQLSNRFREDVFTDGTLGAINYVVRGMGELPGRKSIMLFSDGFTVCSSDYREHCGTIVDSLRKLTDIVNRASVSIYSFDARGVAVLGMGADDKLIGSSINGDRGSEKAIREKISQTLGDRSDELHEKQDGLAYLASETGGRFFFNSNNLNKSLSKALEDQKGYYLIGYQPDSETFDPKTLRYNKLQIKVNRDDVNVRYRSGFFGVEDTDIRPSHLTAAQEILKALTSPFGAKGINVRFNTLFGIEPKTGNFVRSLVHVDVKDLQFTDEPNGEKQAVVDVLAVNFGANGIPVEQFSKTVTLTVKKELYQKILNEGFVYSFTFPIKKDGGYQIGAAVRDSATGKVGSATQFVEVPKLKKDRISMSGIVLENFTPQQWQPSNQIQSVEAASEKSSPLVDTSVRRFRRGTILQYGIEIYKAKSAKGQNPQLNKQLRLFHEGKLVLDSNQIPIKFAEQTDSQLINSTGAIKLGVGMASGDYILQIIVIDNLAKENNRVATQWVQFEIVQ